MGEGMRKLKKVNLFLCCRKINRPKKVFWFCGLLSVMLTLCMHVQYAHFVRVYVLLACVCVPPCLCVQIPCKHMCMCVCVCVFVWLYSNGDSRILGTTLMWPNTRPCRTPVTVWHERWGTEVTIKLNPASAHCCTNFPQNHPQWKRTDRYDAFAPDSIFTVNEA